FLTSVCTRVRGDSLKPQTDSTRTRAQTEVKYRLCRIVKCERRRRSRPTVRRRPPLAGRSPGSTSRRRPASLARRAHAATAPQGPRFGTTKEWRGAPPGRPSFACRLPVPAGIQRLAVSGAQGADEPTLLRLRQRRFILERSGREPVGTPLAPKSCRQRAHCSQPPRRCTRKSRPPGLPRSIPVARRR